MLDRALIEAVHWQMDDAAAAAPSGAIVSDVADLAQCIELAIRTDRGSVPLSPLKGLDLSDFRDRPQGVRHLFLGAAVRECLDRDVPRVDVESVTAAVVDFATVRLLIRWRPRSDVAAQFVETEVLRDV